MLLPALLLRVTPGGVDDVVSDARDPEESLTVSMFWKILRDAGVIDRLTADIRRVIEGTTLEESIEEESSVSKVLVS